MSKQVESVLNHFCSWAGTKADLLVWADDFNKIYGTSLEPVISQFRIMHRKWEEQYFVYLNDTPKEKISTKSVVRILIENAFVDIVQTIETRGKERITLFPNKSANHFSDRDLLLHLVRQNQNILFAAYFVYRRLSLIINAVNPSYRFINIFTTENVFYFEQLIEDMSLIMNNKISIISRLRLDGLLNVIL